MFSCTSFCTHKKSTSITLILPNLSPSFFLSLTSNDQRHLYHPTLTYDPNRTLTSLPPRCSLPCSLSLALFYFDDLDGGSKVAFSGGIGCKPGMREDDAMASTSSNGTKKISRFFLLIVSALCIMFFYLTK